VPATQLKNTLWLLFFYNLFYLIDLIEAQELWNDIDLLEISAKTIDEPRFLVIGKIGEKHWTGIVTYRNDNISIISVRRSRNEEIELYES